ncbi:MAG: mechanosensitive ion channel family protein [Caulobacteraceae bacterium]
MPTPAFLPPPPPPGPPGKAAPSLTDSLHGLAFGGAPAWQHLVDGAVHLAANLLLAAAIFVFTLWAARWASRLAVEAAARMTRRHAPDATLQTFIGSVVRYGVMIVGVIAVLQQLGGRTTSVIAVLGAASLAVGLALQGGLSNVAAGVMILILRPYRIGDRVEITGRVGRVRGLDLFVTRLTDLDNRLVFIPNSKAFGEIIVNFSMHETIRIVMDFGIDYDDDVDLALDLLLQCARENARIAADPAPWAKLTALGDSTVTVTLRAWTDPATYVDTRFDLIKAVKARFEAEGLTFAYPHQVTVEGRSWTAPDRARQKRAEETFGGARDDRAPAPADGEAPLPARAVTMAEARAGMSRPRRG